MWFAIGFGTAIVVWYGWNLFRAIMAIRSLS